MFLIVYYPLFYIRPSLRRELSVSSPRQPLRLWGDWRKSGPIHNWCSSPMRSRKRWLRLWKKRNETWSWKSTNSKLLARKKRLKELRRSSNTVHLHNRYGTNISANRSTTGRSWKKIFVNSSMHWKSATLNWVLLLRARRHSEQKAAGLARPYRRRCSRCETFSRWYLSTPSFLCRRKICGLSSVGKVRFRGLRWFYSRFWIKIGRTITNRCIWFQLWRVFESR